MSDNGKNTLEKLIEPISPDAFYEQFYEKKYLLVQDRPANFYDFLLTVGEIDEALRLGHIPPKNVQLALQGNHLTIDNWTSINNGEFVLNLENILENLNKGHSLILNTLDNYLSKLQSFVQQFKAEMFCRAWMNIYITPFSSIAFDKHYDTHDVFVLQIKGTKRWKLYGTPLPLPHSTQKSSVSGINFDNFTSPTKEFILKEGDLLYIPPGLVHEAIATETTSIHVSLGVKTPKMHDVVHSLWKLCLTDIFFRKSIRSFKRELSEPAEMEKTFKKKLHQLVDDSALSELLQMTDKIYIQNIFRNPPSSSLNDFINKGQLVADSVVARKKDVIYNVHMHNQIVLIEYNGSTTRFPFFLQDSLTSIFMCERISIKEIQGKLAVEEKLKLVKKLLEKGLITVLELNR